MQPLIITKKEAEKVLSCEKNRVEISLDLGISLADAYMENGIVMIGNKKIPLKEFEKVKENSCYTVETNHLHKLAFFSEESNFYYKLMPTSDWPTVTVSSTPMHRRLLLSPKKDALSKIREISPVKGKVLDTCCGLGYTAILAVKKADEVYTFEKDRYISHIARLNPYSKELFSSPNIKFFQEDITHGIKRFMDNYFDRVIHDPPTFKYAPILYSKEFYSELYRVLKRNGILYHYAPFPHRTKNRPFYPKIILDLKRVGFRKVEYRHNSSGVRAVK